MSNIAMFNPSNVPAFAKNAELSATTLALAGGVNTSAGMKRVSIKGGVFRLLAGGNDAVGQQVTFAAGGRADVDGFVGQLHMASVAVGVRVNGDGGNAHAAGGGDDAAGDLSAISD